MGSLGKAVLYTAFLMIANAAGLPVAAQEAQVGAVAEARGAAVTPEAREAAVEAARTGDMRKLVVHAEPVAVPGTAFTDLDGGSHSLEDYRGRWVLLNFWATWCAPCRKEMPALDRLQAERGGADFAVVTLATGRNSPEGIRRFFEEAGVTGLPMYMDPRAGLGPQMGVMGLPVTVLIDPEGREVARLMGEADWAAPEARAMLAAFIGG